MKTIFAVLKAVVLFVFVLAQLTSLAHGAVVKGVWDGPVELGTHEYQNGRERWDYVSAELREKAMADMDNRALAMHSFGLRCTELRMAYYISKSAVIEAYYGNFDWYEYDFESTVLRCAATRPDVLQTKASYEHGLANGTLGDDAKSAVVDNEYIDSIDEIMMTMQELDELFAQYPSLRNGFMTAKENNDVKKIEFFSTELEAFMRDMQSIFTTLHDKGIRNRYTGDDTLMNCPNDTCFLGTFDHLRKD